MPPENTAKPGLGWGLLAASYGVGTVVRGSSEAVGGHGVVGWGVGSGGGLGSGPMVLGLGGTTGSRPQGWEQHSRQGSALSERGPILRQPAR